MLMGRTRKDSITQRLRGIADALPEGEMAVIPHPDCRCDVGVRGGGRDCYLYEATRWVAVRYGRPRLRVTHEDSEVILWR